MESRRQQLWPLGTKISKPIKGHGHVVGEVKTYQSGVYGVVYSNGETEHLNKREMKRYMLSNPSYVSPTKADHRNSPVLTVAAPPASSTTTQTPQQVIDQLLQYPQPEEEEVVVEEEEMDDEVNTQRRERMKREIELMHQELEVTGYARSRSGHKKRVVPRHLSKIRTKKRKMLEKKDAAERALLREEEGGEIIDLGQERDDEGIHRKKDAQGTGDGGGGGVAVTKGRTSKRRLRGSKAALDDDVLHDSMIFRPPTTDPQKKDSVNEVCNDDEDDNHHHEDEEEDEEDLSVVGDEGEYDSEDGVDGVEMTGKQGAKTVSKKGTQKKPSPRKKKSASTAVSQSVKKRRRMYRLRNFQSFRRAQRHGDALSAHARGDYKMAIEKLKAVAKDAPSAPQVYSSLGMVYEDMLKESKEKYYNRKATGDPTATTMELGPMMNLTAVDGSSVATPFVPNQLLREQCDLAKKAYGSHHVSAILCKKDFTLWVRAGDLALEIAYVDNQISCSRNENIHFLDFLPFI
jgi:hypothetical protein